MVKSKRTEPSLTLLKVIIHTKYLMNQKVLALAKEMVRKVIAEILEKLARPIRNPFSEKINPFEQNPLRIAKNFDAKRTTQKNLKNYDLKRKKLYIQKPYFYSQVKNFLEKWQLIILVDQSGSMTSSVIYSAISASIFWGISSIEDTSDCL